MHCNNNIENQKNNVYFIYLVTCKCRRFGLVYKGYLSSAVGRELVAVKTLKGMNKSFNTCNHWSNACTTLSICQALVKSILFVALLRCIHVQHYHIYL